MVVLGVGGTAGLIRTVRANLLDQLDMPYVVTARASGLREWHLLLKYPVRVAINPVVSTVGWILPQLVSGSVIVAMVLSLPTTGPLLLKALMEQEYLHVQVLLVRRQGVSPIDFLTRLAVPEPKCVHSRPYSERSYLQIFVVDTSRYFESTTESRYLLFVVSGLCEYGSGQADQYPPFRHGSSLR